MGFGPPGLQELRSARHGRPPARQDVFQVTGLQPAARRRGRAGTDRPAGRLLHQQAAVPNVDFYTGIIYEAMGFPVEMFPVLFASVGCPAGWPSGRKGCSIRSSGSPRPRQITNGPDERRTCRADRDHPTTPVEPSGKHMKATEAVRGGPPSKWTTGRRAALTAPVRRAGARCRCVRDAVLVAAVRGGHHRPPSGAGSTCAAGRRCPGRTTVRADPAPLISSRHSRVPRWAAT